MAKLPTAIDFNRQTPSASRQIVGYQTGQVEAATANFAQTMGGVIEQEQKKLDDIRVEDAINKAKMSALELSKGENGFSSVKGEDVVTKPVRRDYTTRLNKSFKDIEGGLNQNQVALFRRRSQPLSLSYQSGLIGHIAGETSNYQDSTDMATIDIETQDAAANWTDPQSVVNSASRIKYTVNSVADRKGLSGAAKEQLLNDSMTKMHKGVIYSMLESTPSQAKIYYSKNKKAINGDERTQIEGALKVGTVKQESQILTDEIISKDLPFAASLKEARKPKDADIRAATVDLVKERFREVDLAQNAAVNEAEAYVTEHKTIDGMPPEIHEILSPTTINSLKKSARGLRQNIEPINDQKVWTNFTFLKGRADSGDKAAINKLKDIKTYDFLRDNLDYSHYDRALAVRNSWVAGDAKQKAESGLAIDRLEGNKAAANDYINILLGVKKTGDRSKNQNKFSRWFLETSQLRMDEWRDENKAKRIPAAERNEIFKELSQTFTEKEGAWWGGDKDYDITDIPEDRRDDITDYLMQKNIPVTSRTIIARYLDEEEGQNEEEGP